MHFAECQGCRLLFRTKRNPAAEAIPCPHCRRALIASPERDLAPTRIVAQPAPPPRASWLGAPTLPGYTILGQLGEGGMGVVYRARQDALGREVAIKAIAMDEQSYPSGPARFEQEARAVARLRHPNIVAAYDLARGDSGLLLIMELLEGQTLAARLRQGGVVEERIAWGIIAQASAGLEHASRLGLIHRDIKPANLFLLDPPEGEMLPLGQPLVKVTDFGLALLVNGTADEGRITRAGFAVGTPDYMAPEQSAGGAVDIRADLYALGATAFHMLVGRPPFRADNLYDLMVRKVSALDQELAEVADQLSPGSSRLLADLLAPDPAARLATYRELRERIQDLTARPSAARPPAEPTRRRWRLALAIALGLTAGSFAALAAGRFSALAGGRGDLARPPVLATGRDQPLFDGVSLNGWKPVSGVWEAGRDAEGGHVITGQGTILCPLPPLPCFRLTVGVSIHKANSVQLGFQTPSGEAFVLELTAGEARLRRRPEDRPRTSPVSPSSSGYTEVSFEKHPDRWFVLINGVALGSVEAAPTANLKLRLRAEGGVALFESVEILELLPR